MVAPISNPSNKSASKRAKRIVSADDESPSESISAALARTIDIVTNSTVKFLHEPIELQEYRVFARAIEDTYARLSALWRLRIADLPTLLSQGGCIGCFIVWSFALPSIRLEQLTFVTRALAAPAASSAFDPKPFIHLGVFVVLFATFIVSVWVNYFGKSPKAAESAGTVSKTLLGFFVGIGTNYIRMSE